MASDIQRGTCKWFDSKKGFGFITANDGTDLFVHQSEIKAEGFRKLAEGESVEFVIQTSSDGRKKAVNVTGPSGAAVRGESHARPNGGGGGGGYRDNWNPRQNGGGYNNAGGNGGGYSGGGGGGYGGNRGGYNRYDEQNGGY